MKDGGRHSVAIHGDVAFDEDRLMLLEIRLFAANSAGIEAL